MKKTIIFLLVAISIGVANADVVYTNELVRWSNDTSHASVSTFQVQKVEPELFMTGDGRIYTKQDVLNRETRLERFFGTSQLIPAVDYPHHIPVVEKKQEPKSENEIYKNSIWCIESHKGTHMKTRKLC